MRAMICARLTVVLCGFAPGCLSCGGNSDGGASTTPGHFYVVDRSALYDPNLNDLANGGFESGLQDWQFTVLAGSPTYGLVSSGTGNALQITTQRNSNVKDALVIASPTVSVQSVERYYLGFDVRTDFGVLDEGWGGLGTEESPPGPVDIIVNATVQWGSAGGTPQTVIAHQVRHALKSWRPVLVALSVPAGATSLQARFLVMGAVPKDTVAHTTYLDNVRLFAEPDSVAPKPIESVPGYRIEAQYSSTAYGGVLTGTLINLTQTAAAVDLIYGIDIDAVRMDYDISRNVSVDPSVRIYEDPVAADWYSDLTMSAVPVQSVTDSQGRTLGLGVPLDVVRIFQFRYDSLWKQLQVLHRFGMNASGPQDRAPFEVHVLSTSSPWGFREIWRTYTTTIEPAAFASAGPGPGGTAAFYNFLFDSSDTPRYSDFGVTDGDDAAFTSALRDLGVRWVIRRQTAPVPPRVYQTLEKFDLELWNYDYPSLLEMSAGASTGVPPNYESIKGIVDTTASAGGSGYPALKNIQAQNALKDARGDLMVNRVFAPDFGGGQWLFRIPVDMRPSSSAYLDTILTYKDLPFFADGKDAWSTGKTSKDRLTGMMMDGFMKEPKVLDDRVAAASDGPLTYDPNTGLPTAHLCDANLAYYRELRNRLNGNGLSEKFLLANLTALGPGLFGMPVLQSAGWESSPFGGTNFGHREFNTRRMMMPEKLLGCIYRDEWHSLTDTQIRQYFETTALLGVYPDMLKEQLPPTYFKDRIAFLRSLSTEALPVIDALHGARWQVIPQAWMESLSAGATGTAALRVERFGTAAPYYFSTLNTPSGLMNEPAAVDQTVRLTIDLGPLGLSTATASVVFGDTLLTSASGVGNQLVLVLDLKAGRGAVLKLQ